jgi:nucleotide-binding universal stress UspA family protein
MIDPTGFATISTDAITEQFCFADSAVQAAETRFWNDIPIANDWIEWRGCVNPAVVAVIRQSSVADLIVVGRGNDARSDAGFIALDPAEVVMSCGRPVLIVPPGISRLSGDHTVVAWSNTREARRAVIDALPFLQLASRVSVVEMAAESELTAAPRRVSEVEEFLGLKDVDARGYALEDIEGSVADQIFNFAERKHADLIMAGGYGHAWLRERVFGDVTDRLLHHCPKCCLVSH